MKLTGATRGIAAGVLAFGAVAGTGGVAAATPPPDPIPEVNMKNSATYTFEYRISDENGDIGSAWHVEPGKETAIAAEGYTTIEFRVDGKKVNSFNQLETDRTLQCEATGDSAEPIVNCAF